MSDGIEIRPATEADLREFAGDNPVPTVRALAGVKDGQLLAIGGLRYLMLNKQRRLILFFNLKPEGRKYRKAIVRGMRMLIEMVKDRHVMAICSPNEPGAPSLMRRMGFKFVAPSEKGDIYQC